MRPRRVVMPGSSGTVVSRMLGEVSRGLSQPQREISPKYFYDEQGSKLFEAITRLPEYYLTTVERELLLRQAPRWMSRLLPESLVELGAGSAAKTRILLDALLLVSSRPVFVPLDVSDGFLQDTARALVQEYPGLTVSPAVADFTHEFDLGQELPSPTLFALLGSTIGNFEPDEAAMILGHISARMNSSDAFLLGADLKPGPGKSVATLEAAYNDAAGITARFNLNVLSVLNRELGSDFDLDRYSHRVFYDTAKDRIEMHLVATEAQLVTFCDGSTVTLRAGETIRTEISSKYDRATVEDLITRAGLELREWCEDDQGRYALIWAERSGGA